MCQNSYDILRVILAILLCGISIKLLDDFIDENRDYYAPYMMAAVCISTALWRGSLSIFLSSYIIGMFHDENLKLVSSLRVYHEQLIAIVISILINGFKVSMWSIALICAVQLIDDLIDEKEDTLSGRKNWAIKIGRIETAAAAFIFVILSLYLDSLKTAICMAAALSISWIFRYFAVMGR